MLRNAEKKLGRYLKKESKVITKIPEIKGSFIDMENVRNVEEIFLNSLKNLKLKKVYALLTHSSKDFLKPVIRSQLKLLL